FTGFWAAVLGGITPVTVAVPPSYEERIAVVNKLYNTWKLLGRPAVLTSEDLREPLSGLARRLGEEAMEVLSVDELATQPPADDVHPAAADDLVFLQLTSGSTGIPKCIQERHRGVVAHIHGSRQFNRLRPDDVILNWLPMDHVVPTLTYHLKDVYLGCQEIQIPPALVLAAPLLWLDRIEAHRVTHTWSPNFGFKLVSEQLAQNPGRRWDLSSLRYAMNAGEQVTMPVVREFLERVAPFGVSERVMQPAYGMAEVCTAMTYGSDFSVANGSRRFRKSTLNGLLEPAAPEDTEPTVDFIDVGPPIPGVDVRIVDRQNRLLPEGVIGRLQIQGEVVTPGYLENAEANREAFAGDNWFNTGDLGFLLDGRLSITGREKEIIIVRGANFYCYEIEDVVNGVEGVEPTWSGACGLADPRSGTEELAVFFVPAGAHEELRIDRRTVEVVERVRAAVTSSLGISPRRVVPMTAAEFPKTTSGKIQRTQLKSWLEEGRFTENLKRLDLLEENANTLPDWFHRKVWRRREGTPERRQSKGGALVFADAAGLGDFVAAGLERAGQPAVLVEPGGAWERPGPGRFRIDPADPEHYRRLLSETGQMLGEVGRVVHLWTWGDSTRGTAGTGGLEELRRAQREGAVGLLLLIQALERHRAISGRAGAEDRVQLLAVSSHSQPVLPDDRLVCGRGTLPPLVKTAPQELPWLDARHLDLPAEDVEAAGAPVLHELAIVSGEREVALRQGRRLVARLAR
ncbi:MAG TPA: AMP-binding protein, partial [Thermoanaerobaculia bacterium]